MIVEQTLSKYRAGQRIFVFVGEDRVRMEEVRSVASDIANICGGKVVELRGGEEIGDLRDNDVFFVYSIFTERDASTVVEILKKIYFKSGYGGALLVVVPRSDLLPDTVLAVADVVVFPQPTARERFEVIKSALEGLGKTQSIGESVIRFSRGLMLDEVRLAVVESVVRYGELRDEIFREWKIRLLRKSGLEYIEPEMDLSYVGGYRFLKDYVRNHVLVYFRNADAVRKFGLKAPRGMLLAGIGGTGKSWFASALAGELSVPVVKMNMADVMAGGMGEVRLRRVLQIIDTLSPVVVFMDEIDQIALKREEVKDPARRGMINVLMEWLGDYRRDAFVIGATNLIHQIDENFLRSGRFDAIIYMPPPDREAREEILRIHAVKLRKLEGVEFNPDILSAVAEKTDLWVGSDLEALVQKAFEYAMIDYIDGGEARVTVEHFERAKRNVEPNMELRKSMLRATLNGIKMLPQGAVIKEPIEETERMINVGKRRKAEMITQVRRQATIK